MPVTQSVFGHQRRADFLLADGIAHINHGGYGATPRVVLDAATRWRHRMEADPSTFFRRDLVDALRAAAARVSRSFGGQPDDWVFVENTTAGINAIVASMAFEPGDEIVRLSHVYGAVRNTIGYHAERQRLVVRDVKVPLPFTDADALVADLKKVLGPKTRLAVLDHVTSASAITMPIAALVAACHERGVPVAVDGAHALGLMPVDAPAIGADWYVGNLHKWAFGPKGSAVIWCSPQWRDRTHPTSISHYLGMGLTAEFDYAGTRDNSSWLAAPTGLDYLEGFGTAAVWAHNNALAQRACDLLSAAWGTEIAAAQGFRTAMIALGLPGNLPADRTTARRIAKWLIEDHGITAGIMVVDGRLWLRVSAQLYNELSDYEPLADLPRLLIELK